MANPTDVLMQLQAKLDTKYMVNNAKIMDDLDEEISEDIGNQASGSIGSGFGSSLANKRYNPGDELVDVPDVDAVDEPYTTNRPVSIDGSNSQTKVKGRMSVEDLRSMIEQAVAPQADEEEMSPEDPGPDAPGHTNAEAPPAEDPQEPTMDPNMDPSMQDPSMGGGGFGMEEDPLASKTPSELGRIYELKKIYTRLTTIESYLSESSDPELLRIRLLVSKSIELFEILSSNIPIYKPPKAPKERLDEIIIMYYKFLKQVYESVAKYYKTKKNSLGGDGLQKTTITFTDKELI